MELKRLNKAISETGYCSRREADKLIEQGKVLVNGKRPELGTKVSAKDEIKVNGQIITKEVPFVLIAFNKPVGITCTTERHVQGNIIDYINYPERIFPIGRLDKPSEGLIFLTNDGDIVNKILRAKNNHEKEYIVKLNKSYDEQFIASMSNGVPILDTVTKKCSVESISDDTFRIVLTEGLNRQIRRMCSYFGYEVVSLKRIRIMNVELGSLPKGEYRDLSQNELEVLLKDIEHSVKTEDASK